MKIRRFNENVTLERNTWSAPSITIDIPKDHYDTIYNFIISEKDEVDDELVKNIYKEYINFLLGVNTHDMSEQFEVWMENNFDDFL